MNPHGPERSDPSGLDSILKEGHDPTTTPYDYIVVGSGAGGGPLACRLARAGMNILVIEAGVDAGARAAPPTPEPKDTEDARTAQRANENERLIYHCPGLHAAATEPHEYARDNPDDPMHTSWGFDVRHFSVKPPTYYPRASALGGCTAHHAMIAIYGADSDWQRIADLTSDDSWASGKMREIYRRIERASYVLPGGPLGYWRELFFNWVAPARNASAERGDSGWLDVRTSDPHLAMSDPGLMNLIIKTVFAAEGLSSKRVLWRWLKHLFSGMLFRDLDLNDEETMRESPEGVALVPIAINDDGVRRGPREWLLETRQALRNDPDPFSGKLHIATGVFVRRIIFSREEKDAPRAVGVEYEQGRHLYEASPFFKPTTPPSDVSRCFARREILLCGGTFNTPQILMLSGIGEEPHLREKGIEGLPCIQEGNSAKIIAEGFVNLPGVGQNLRDRCEISVISEMARPFASLSGVKFDPGAKDDPALEEWKARNNRRRRKGIYTTNGAVLAILKRSRKDVIEPDLLMFGFPVAFRGYYRGWSKHLLVNPAANKTAHPEESRNLWSWVILKAYSANRGSVRLQSAEPSKVPAINFRYFGDCRDAEKNQGSIPGKDGDLEALLSAVGYVRALNRNASRFMKDKNALSAEIQPGQDKPEGSAELRDWIVQQTWGHHAAGTCRIGADPWRADPVALKDKGAVIDSRFRVHGVRGLRVVDASVFPQMPGYFIVVAIYMIAEKAADTILDELSL